MEEEEEENSVDIHDLCLFAKLLIDSLVLK